MKNILCFLFMGLLFSCEKEAAKPEVFQKPIIETLSFYSISNTSGEVSMDVNNVMLGISEVGIVMADHAKPTTTDNKQSALNVSKSQVLTFVIPNLQKGKTYYARSFYRLGEEVVYGNEIGLTHQFTGEWRRLLSPPLSPDEYIYAGDVDLGLSGDALQCYKVNSFTNEANLQIYYADFGQWNATFWGNRNPNVQPSLVRFNPIRANFQNNSGTPLTLYGAGYEVSRRSSKFYSKTINILQTNGNWTPYPGADAATTSFGIGKLVYVLENLPYGKLWVFDYGDLSWKTIGTFPYQKNANYIGFDAGERFFLLVEPLNNQEESKELYEYLVAENKWVRRADFIGENRRNGAAFVINDQRIFYGLGKQPNKGNGLRDIFEYDTKTDSWKKSVDYQGAGTVDVLAAGSFDRAYIGFGKRVKATNVGGEEYSTVIDFWEFKPKN